jgi:hypothetical protein
VSAKTEELTMEGLKETFDFYPEHLKAQRALNEKTPAFNKLEMSTPQP